MEKLIDIIEDLKYEIEYDGLLFFIFRIEAVILVLIANIILIKYIMILFGGK